MGLWFKNFGKPSNGNKPQKVADPVCGMKIEPGVFSTKYKGKIYYFCSDYCKQQFDIEPGQYI
jgi:YHS domain-containing protein